MITIDRHIQYLLTRHDCVIVPGLGAFVVDYRPAYLKDGKFFPPERAAMFNPDILHNDGLLASSVARACGITYEAAESLVAQEVATMLHQLDTEGEITIGGVGTLSRETGSPVQFLPSSLPISNIAYRHLPTFEAPTLVELEAKSDGEPEHESSGLHIHISPAVVRAAASVAAVLILGIVCTTPHIADPSDPTLTASLSAPEVKVKQVKPVAVPERVPDLFIALPGDDGKAVADTVKRVPVAVKEAVKEASAATPAAPSWRIAVGEPYCIVVASLDSREGAEAFIASKRGARMEVVEQEGRFRVYAATAATEAEAKATARTMQARYPGAWSVMR